MSMTPHSEATVLELRVLPDALLVATVRRFVRDLCLRILVDADVTSRVAVAAHELLDNASRHASDDGCMLRIELNRTGDEAVVVIVTENRVNEERPHVVTSVLGEMSANSDRGSYYRSLLQRVAGREEVSGLGLGRVFAESEFTLSSTLVGDLLQIRAEGRFSLATGSALP